MRFLLTPIVLAAFVFFVSTTSSTVLNDSNTCETLDVTANGDYSTSCIGVISGENDSEALINNSDVSGNAYWSDFFGYRDWQAGSKWETDNNGGSSDYDNFGLGFALVPGGNTSPGDWIINESALSLFEDFMFVIKQGNGFAAYYFDTTEYSAGSYDSIAFNQSNGISHASIYVRGQTTQVSEPSILILFSIALLLFARKRKLK